MAGIEVKTTDRVTIQCPVPADRTKTTRFAEALSEYVAKGYEITGAQDIEGGSQRDPYVIGFKITLERK